MRRALLILALLVAAVPGAVQATEQPQTRERCEWAGMPYLDCVTAGFAWVIIGTDGDDRLVGYDNDDIIRSGKGADFVNGRGGRDVCYIQPPDTVKGCEQVRRTR
jgi:hypothetical protein